MHLQDNLKAIRAITFDLDDTLWDCKPAIVAAEGALFEWHREVTPEILGVHDSASLGRYRIQYAHDHPELCNCVTSMRLECLRSLLCEFGLSGQLAEEGFAVFYKARSVVSLYDGTLQMLSELKEHYRLAAITNGNADLHIIGIADYFEHIYAANADLPPKPAPDMFNQCLAQWDLPAYAVLHIGDNPRTDVTGGHNAGVQTLWFNQYNESWPDDLEAPHYEVQSVSEIVPLIHSS